MGVDHEVLKAASRWRFRPATVDGEPVEVYYNLTLNMDCAMF